MGKAIFKLKSGRTVGRAALGAHGDVPGSVLQETHDGDTVIVVPDGNVGVRFLGVDTPEVSFTLPGSTTFVSIAADGWKQFLSGPFAAGFGEFDPPLTPGLRAHLDGHVGPGTAENHHRLAKAAETALEDLITADIQELGQTPETFRFFLSFANEVMDGYGRLLGYMNRDQPDATVPAPRPKSYNERGLATGSSAPYFIWPNLDPYRPAASLVKAVPEPGGIVPAAVPAEAAQPLHEARASVAAARAQHLGIFEQNDPLRLFPFELRFLARRKPPDRWVIDLSAGDDVLHQPQDYPAIANPEDRLFVPPEYVALFESKGWQPSA